MASKNETVAEIVREMNCSHEGMIAFEFQNYASRIEAAHRREVAELSGEKIGILRANESLAADNTRLRGEVAELRECLKEACRLQLRCDSCKIRKCDSICVMKLKWRKALEGENHEGK